MPLDPDLLVNSVCAYYDLAGGLDHGEIGYEVDIVVPPEMICTFIGPDGDEVPNLYAIWGADGLTCFGTGCGTFYTASQHIYLDAKTDIQDWTDTGVNVTGITN